MIESTGPRSGPIEVLLVEDNAGDARLMREAMKDAKMHISLHVAPDGEEAMAFLRREGGHTRAPRPDLILLDLNLPKMDGREVLNALRENPMLVEIPVVILTTSSAAEDVLTSCRVHANCCITKPVSLDGILKVVQNIDDLWLSVVKLPRERAA